MSTPRPIKLCIETFGDEAGYVAWLDNEKFKGIVVQSNSYKGVLEELFISIKVKFAYDYGIEIGGVEEKIKALVDEKFDDCDNHKEINLNFA